MDTSYDAIVVGLGAVGSAAVYHLARRGKRVLGLDRFAPPHAHGSSHGGSRIIRKAYFEGVRYLPLLEQAYPLWRDLEAASGRALLHVIGGLNVGPPEGSVVMGARAAAEAQGLPHEVLMADVVQKRFPAFHLPEGHVAVWEPSAGYLHPEHCIEAHLTQARRHGAVLHVEEPVRRWQPDGEGVAVVSDQATYRATRLVLCAGGWLGDLLPGLAMPLTIERQVNGWFRPRAHPAHFDPARCPVYIWDLGGDDVLYGFPDTGRGVKVGLHHNGTLIDHPDELHRTPTDADEAALHTVLRRLLPGADGPLVHAAVCFYTNTPDRHYRIDRHPEYPQVLFASACSGHGFKASNVVGEALADLVTGASPRVDLQAFRLGSAADTA